MSPRAPVTLVIMASLGVLTGCPSSAVDAGGDPIVDPTIDPIADPEGDPALAHAEGLAAEKTWTRCLSTWKDAAEAAFGGDPYPFTEKGKATLLARLETSASLVKELRGRGLLTDAEAGLLEQDIATLRSGVWAKRPKEMELATCYEPMMYTPRQDALQSLAPRVELLEGMAAQQTLQADVIVQVLEQVRRDLTKLTAEDGMGLNPDEQAQADEVQRRVEAAIAAIDHKLSSPHDAPDVPAVPEVVDPASIIPEATADE